MESDYQSLFQVRLANYDDIPAIMNITREAFVKYQQMSGVENLAALEESYNDVKKDIEAVVKATPAVVKVIFENYYLTKEEIALACRITEEAGAHYVKTSTGFAAGGATVEDIKLMRASVSPNVKVKAAGGISNYADCIAMIEAGSDRIGISKTQEILKELEAGM